MYRVAICENEPIMLDKAREMCSEILNELEVDHEISAYSSAEALETVLDEMGDPFHLLLLDINLEQKSGLTLAKELYARSCESGIVFMTSYREYAAEGYDAHPIHFLTKPIDRMRLAEAIKIDLKRRALPKTIMLNTGRKMVALPIKDVYYIESRNHHIFIYKEKDTLEIRLSLSEVESMLPNQFQRCHASYLVNLDQVREVGKSEVILRGGKRIPISRTYGDRFATAYLRYFNTYLS